MIITWFGTMSRSAKPAPSGPWNNSAVCERSIRMSAGVGPRPIAEENGDAGASSSARQFAPSHNSTYG